MLAQIGRLTSYNRAKLSSKENVWILDVTERPVEIENFDFVLVIPGEIRFLKEQIVNNSLVVCLWKEYFVIVPKDFLIFDEDAGTIK